jgi:hypothetical protein
MNIARHADARLSLPFAAQATAGSRAQHSLAFPIILQQAAHSQIASDSCCRQNSFENSVSGKESEQPCKEYFCHERCAGLRPLAPEKEVWQWSCRNQPEALSSQKKQLKQYSYKKCFVASQYSKESLGYGINAERIPSHIEEERTYPSPEGKQIETQEEDICI